MTPFLKGPKFDSINDFLNDELHVVLKLRDGKMCKHSIFFQLLNRNMFNGILKIRLCYVTRMLADF